MSYEYKNTSNIDDNYENVSLFSSDEEVDIINTTIKLMIDYVDENPRAISEPDFQNDMIESIKELLLMNFDNFFNKMEDYEDEIEDLIYITLELFYIHFMPKRSYSYTFEKINNSNDIDIITNRLKELANMPQSIQRTKDWYEDRHNLITGSNGYKVFGSISSINQLIYEKCQPLNFDIELESSKSEYVNTSTPMHWGQKYEPVSLMYYENKYDTKISEYGCIKHDIYNFLGASPDGIVSDPLLPRFGRMLEIKNIVNRDIDGIPKKEYWIQMQLQMETCNLNECDFLETRFNEYDSFTSFNKDGDFNKSENNELKGIIMHFSTTGGKPLYIYKPLNMIEEYYNNVWEEEQMEKHQNLGLTWISNIYWKLVEISCVLVPRNKKWFCDNKQVFKDVWDIILRERETGFEHRAPGKRIKKEKNDDITEICLIQPLKINL